MKIHGTAKGGALSTKDFGVAFSAGGAAQTCQGESYSGDAIGVGQDYPSGEITAAGMIPLSGNTLIGTVASRFSLLMKLQGSVSDLEIGAKIYDPDDIGNPLISANTINNVDSDDYNFRQFEFSADFTVTEGFYYVIYQVSGAFSNSNRINIRMNGSAADNNTVAYYSDDWHDDYFGSDRAISICFT